MTQLHDQDFYLWTQAQAAALRAEAHKLREGVREGARAEGLDFERLADAVENIGQSNLSGRLAGARVILELLFKLAAGRRRGKYGGWRATIIVRRAEVRAGLTEGLRNRIAQELPRLHEEARAAVEKAFAADEPEALPIDDTLTWTLPEILGEDNDPLS
ncbi:MAG: DUF29 family protein [Hyphomonadaceae bacterium]|nr:DUF29 family protein [Hyphomonadaceae bacterium]